MLSDGQLARLCHETDRRLLNSFAYATGADLLDDVRVRFPTYRTGRLRVSEQEAKQAFIEATIASTKLGYSVEVPTSSRYGFTDPGRTRSAMTDLVLIEDREIVFRIEFKAGGLSLRRRSVAHVRKDIAKLVGEPEPGLWFHVLKSANSETVRSVLDVLAKAITDQGGHQRPGVQIAVHLVVLDSDTVVHVSDALVERRQWG